MQKKIRLIFFTLIFLSTCFPVKAQSDTSTPIPTYKIGIFAPLYLDSAFTDDTYNYGKEFPKFTLQGLDFVQGAQIALDSLAILNVKIDAFIYDSKSISKSIATLIADSILDSLDIIIGSVKEQEYT